MSGTSDSISTGDLPGEQGNVSGKGAQVRVQESEAQVSDRYEHARMRVRVMGIFYAHSLIFASINSFLLLIDMLTGPGLWFFWALFGWGIALAFHAGLVWGIPHVSVWEEKMIAREMSRHTK